MMLGPSRSILVGCLALVATAVACDAEPRPREAVALRSLDASDGSVPTTPSLPTTPDQQVDICCEHQLGDGAVQLQCSGDGCLAPAMVTTCEEPEECALFCDVAACDAVAADMNVACYATELAYCMSESIEEGDSNWTIRLTAVACAMHAKLWCALGNDPGPP